MNVSTLDSTFAERFAYARWLASGRTGEEPSQTRIAKAVGRTQPSVAEWYSRKKPPADWEVHEPLAQLLEVSAGWLVRDEEAPPEPQLWAWWFAQRHGHRAKPGTGMRAISSSDAAAAAGKPRRRAGGQRD